MRPPIAVAGLEDDNVAETAGAKLGRCGQARDSSADHRMLSLVRVGGGAARWRGDR